MAKTAKIEAPNAVIIGFIPIRRPIAMPPKAVCERPSPIIASFLRIKKRPTMPHTIATIIPPMRAFWKNWYPKRLKRLMFMMGEYSFTVVLVEYKVEMFAIGSFKELCCI